MDVNLKDVLQIIDESNEISLLRAEEQAIDLINQVLYKKETIEDTSECEIIKQRIVDKISKLEQRTPYYTDALFAKYIFAALFCANQKYPFIYPEVTHNKASQLLRDSMMREIVDIKLNCSGAYKYAQSYIEIMREELFGYYIFVRLHKDIPETLLQDFQEQITSSMADGIEKCIADITQYIEEFNIVVDITISKKIPVKEFMEKYSIDVSIKDEKCIEALRSGIEHEYSMFGYEL